VADLRYTLNIAYDCTPISIMRTHFVFWYFYSRPARTTRHAYNN